VTFGMTDCTLGPLLHSK